MVDPALRQELPGPATVQWDGQEFTVTSRTCLARMLLPRKVSDYFLLSCYISDKKHIIYG